MQLKQELTWSNIAIVYQPKNQLFCREKKSNFDRFSTGLFADVLQNSSLQNSQKNTCATVLI